MLYYMLIYSFDIGLKHTEYKLLKTLKQIFLPYMPAYFFTTTSHCNHVYDTQMKYEKYHSNLGMK